MSLSLPTMQEGAHFELENEESMSPRRAMEVFWLENCLSIADGNGEAFVPFEAAELMGFDNVNEMAQRLAVIRNKTIYVIKNVSSECYVLTPEKPFGSISSDDVPGVTTYSPPPQAPPKVPRPPNCFILYRKAKHEVVRAANPGISNNEISRILGARWKNETEEVRARYTELAEILKRKHAIDHPDYQYAPRRPSQRRRRASRRARVPAPGGGMSMDEFAAIDEELAGSASFDKALLDADLAVEDAVMNAEEDIDFSVFEDRSPFFDANQVGQLPPVGWASRQFAPVDLTDYMDIIQAN